MKLDTPYTKRKMLEFHTWVSARVDADTWSLLGVWFIFLDALNVLFKSILIAHTPKLEAQLLPAFAHNPATGANVHLITYTLLIVGLFGTIAIVWLRRIIPKLSLHRIISDGSLVAPKFAAAATFLCGFLLKGTLLPWLFFTASFCFAMQAFINHFSAQGQKQKISKWNSNHGAYACVLLALTLCATGVVGLRWFVPLKFTNDYYELNSSVKTGELFQFLPAQAPESLTQAQARDCLSRDENGVFPSSNVKNHLPKKVRDRAALETDARAPAVSEKRTSRLTDVCPLSKDVRPRDSAMDIMRSLDSWQEQGGRLLFHHAYIFVPAHYMITHGLNLAVPALYGYGHTAVYAFMMKLFGDDLSTYFKIFYALSFAGILAIAAIIGLVARSRTTFLFAAALSLIAYYCVDYSALYLAASFTPMRGIGFAVQMASIFYFIRSQGRPGYLALVGGLIFSILWNYEFAMIGALGQAFILLSPALRCALPQRVKKIGVFGFVLVAAFAAKNILEQGMLVTNNVGLYNVGTHSIDTHGLIQLLIKVFLVMLLSSYIICRNYKDGERHARFALLGASLLMLIKYVFNGSPVHLYATLVVVLPMAALIIPPFEKTLSYRREQIFGCVFLSVLLVAVTLNFQAGAKGFAARVITPAVMEPWQHLNETVLNAVPEEAIRNRVETIRAAMAGKERMLLLSPYDHLLSFYVNPKSYCGSFDTMLNLVLQKDRDTVVQCALGHDHVTVVYDKDLEVGCPDYALYKDDGYRASCENRLLLKQALSSILTKLKPDLRLIKETGDLQIYDVVPHRGSTQTKM